MTNCGSNTTKIVNYRGQILHTLNSSVPRLAGACFMEQTSSSLSVKGDQTMAFIVTVSTVYISVA